MDSKSLCCASCGKQFGQGSCIVDDSYFVYGKPAYLLQDIDLDCLVKSKIEKRIMRSGSYDIVWVTCKCNFSLGFVYEHVYEDSYNYKLGKAVIAKENVTVRSVVEKQAAAAKEVVSDNKIAEATNNEKPPSTVLPVAAAEAAVANTTITAEKLSSATVRTSDTEYDSASVSGDDDEWEIIDDPAKKITVLE